MTDDNGDDVQKVSMRKIEQYNVGDEPVKIVGTIQIRDCPVEIADDIWNAAIEAAAQYLEKDRWRTVPNIIRELKVLDRNKAHLLKLFLEEHLK